MSVSEIPAIIVAARYTPTLVVSTVNTVHESVREQRRVEHARSIYFPKRPQVLRHPPHLQRAQKPPPHRMAARQSVRRKVRGIGFSSAFFRPEVRPRARGDR